MLVMKMTKKQTKHLDALADEIDCSRVGVIKRAVTLLQVCLREKRDGGEIYILDKEGKPLKKVVGLGIG